MRDQVGGVKIKPNTLEAELSYVRIRLRPNPLESASVVSSSDSLLAVLRSPVNVVSCG